MVMAVCETMAMYLKAKLCRLSARHLQVPLRPSRRNNTSPPLRTRSSSFFVSSSSSIVFIPVSFPQLPWVSLSISTLQPAFWVKMTSRKLRISCPGVIGGRYIPTYRGAYSGAKSGTKSGVYSRAYSGAYSGVKTPAKTLA